MNNYHDIIISGGGGGGHYYEDRLLQFQFPDYTSPPLPEALALTPEEYQSDEAVDELRDLDAAGNCTVDGNRCQIVFPIDAAKFAQDPKVGVVFYNGGLVDPRGYTPIASILNERYGLPVVMPVFAQDLAFVFGQCDSNRVDHAKAEFPGVEKWVLAGHSFGGVAASADFWSRHQTDEAVAGLALIAADLQATLGCGDNLTDSNVPMAQLLATNDGVLNRTRVDSNRFRNSLNDTLFMEIAGAGHNSFGAYDSSERGALLNQFDGDQTVSREVVWDLTASAIAAVASRTGVPLPTPTVASPDDPATASPSSSANGVPVPDPTAPPSATSAGAALHPSGVLFWSALLWMGIACSRR